MGSTTDLQEIRTLGGPAINSGRVGPGARGSSIMVRSTPNGLAECRDDACPDFKSRDAKDQAFRRLFERRTERRIKVVETIGFGQNADSRGLGLHFGGL